MRRDPRKTLLEHSQAKVRLLRTYLVNYLSVITNAATIKRVRIFDLFCGRGIYDNDGEGSPVAILRIVKDTYFTRKARNQTIPAIDCFFSDKKREHVDAVSEAISRLHLHYPEIGNLRCGQEEYRIVLKDLFDEGPRPSSEKSFVFLDPYGYKDIKASEIKELLKKKAEVLLFLPIQFMYRFESEGTPEALREFIAEMKNFDQWTISSTPGKFVEQLRDTFREYLGKTIYVSTFLIEKDSNTLFSLFFFTTHLLGYERMVDAKWKEDQDAGQGWSFRKVPGQEVLMPGLETFYLENDLLAFLMEGTKTNCDVYAFAVIDKEYRSTHATKVCTKLIKEGRIKVISLSGQPATRMGLYINYEHFRDGDNKVRFEVVNDGSNQD